jgi:hypothetical protein
LFNVFPTLFILAEVASPSIFFPDEVSRFIGGGSSKNFQPKAAPPPGLHCLQGSYKFIKTLMIILDLSLNLL